QHPGRGNGRELGTPGERAVVQCEGERIVASCLPFTPPAPAPSERADQVVLPIGTTLDAAERELILRTLEANKRNKTRAAEVLGVTPKTLHNKLHRYAAESTGSAPS